VLRGLSRVCRAILPHSHRAAPRAEAEIRTETGMAPRGGLRGNKHHSSKVSSILERPSAREIRAARAKCGAFPAGCRGCGAGARHRPQSRLNGLFTLT